MDIIEELTDKDDKQAYARAREIAAASEQSPIYYPQLAAFASLLKHKKSYVRIRAFVLICSQARWDTNEKIAEILPTMLTLFHDPKPTVVRQCLNAAKELVVFRPELRSPIAAELASIDLSQYRETMAPLIYKDIQEIQELLCEN